MLLDERVYDTILYYMVSAYILCAQELAVSQFHLANRTKKAEKLWKNLYENRVCSEDWEARRSGQKSVEQVLWEEESRKDSWKNVRFKPWVSNE